MELELNESNFTDCLDTARANSTFDCVSLGLQVFHGVSLALLLAASLSGNITVLYLVYSHKDLRQKSVLASLGLVVADLLMASIWVFQGEASIIAGEWPFQTGGCSFFAYVYLTLLLVRYSEVLVFTNDRFVQIFSPFWHQRWSNVKIVIATILAWVVPAIVSIPTNALGFSDFYLTLTACSVNCGDNQSCANGVIALFGIFITIGGIIPTGMYIIAYLYSWKKRVEMKRMLQMGSTGNGMSHGGLQLWNSAQERKALTTCFLVFITNIITNCPIYVTSSLRSREHIYSAIPLWAHFIASYIFLLGPVMDPLVIMRTKNFREVIKRVFICRKGEGVVAKALRNIVVLGSFSTEGSSSSNYRISSTETNPSLGKNISTNT